ncbi:MAG: ABC transporter permease [Christensenellales bacterium]
MEKANRERLNLKILYSKYGIGLVLVILIIVAYVVESKFLSGTNIMNVIRQVSVSGILAVGMTFVIISGAIDLSAGNMLGLAAVTSVMLQKSHVNMYLAILAAIAVVVLFSSFTGYGVSHGVPAFIMTLAMTQTVKGVSYVATGGMPHAATNEAYKWFGQGFVGPIPVPIIIFVLCVGISYLVLSRTKIGRSIYALGGNMEAARLSGINIRKTRILVYSIMGILIAISGIVVSSRVYSAEPLTGEGYQLDAIAATVIGGTKMSGGEGSVLRTVIGAFIIGILSNILNLTGTSPHFQMVAKGVIIFIAVAADTWKRN